MIRQHEDAIALAKVENAEGQYPYAVALANTVMVGQASQVRTMRADARLTGLVRVGHVTSTFRPRRTRRPRLGRRP